MLQKIKNKLVFYKNILFPLFENPYHIDKYEKIFYIKYIQPGMTVFDVGANVGNLIDIFSPLVKKNGQVFAFEPIPETYEKLKKITELKGYSNVNVFNLGILDSKKIETFYVYDELHSAWNTIVDRPFEKYNIDVKVKNKIKVNCISLDEFCTENNINNIDLLKIDVEGAEMLVLKGATNLFKQKKLNVVFLNLGKLLTKLVLKQSISKNFLKHMDIKFIIFQNSKSYFQQKIMLPIFLFIMQFLNSL